MSKTTSNEGKKDEVSNAMLNFEVILMQREKQDVRCILGNYRAIKMFASYWETIERSMSCFFRHWCTRGVNKKRIFLDRLDVG